MMSVGLVQSSTNIQKYFIDKDNYYLTDKSELREAAVWMGKGAEKLGILGDKVEEKQFLDLLEGRLPNGEQIGRMRDGTINHRPATDLTFSPSKSVSEMALVQGDSRLVEVHNRAVSVAMSKVETLYAEARTTISGNTTYEKTGNLTIAAFRHTTSRELDANIHTHAVTINATEREDGNWRALSSRQKADMKNLEHGFRENILANQHYLGMIYNSEVAKGVVDCGYSIKVKDKYGNFEIEGIPPEFLKSQSKRRTQIETLMNKRGVSGGKAAQQANLQSRQKKGDTNLEVIQEFWKKDAKDQGVDLDKVYQDSLKPKSPENPISSELPSITKNASDAINDSIAHLSQYGVQIRHGDIIRQAFVFAGGTVEHDELEQVVSEKCKEGELLGKPNNYYTTKNLVETEKDFSQQINQSKGMAYSIDVGRSGIVSDTLKNKDRLQIIDVKGFKNEAKLIDSMVKTAESNLLNVYVLNQSKSKLNLLHDEVSRDGTSLWKAIKNIFKHELMQTVGKFEHDYENKLKQPFVGAKQDFIIVTDAQKLSYKDISSLDSLSEQGKAKVVFLNNTESIQGFSAGNPIKVMKENGVANHRSVSPSKKAFVELTQADQSQKALAEYAVTNKATTIVTLTNKAQQNITKEIRGLLQQTGELSVQEVQHHTLSTRGLSDVEKTKIKSYKIGDQVTLNPFKEDQKSFIVSGTNSKDNSLIITNKEGKNSVLNLADKQDKQDMQVNKRQTLDISVGESLRTTRNLYIDQANKIEKNTPFKVTSITDDGIRVQHQDKSHWISKDKLATSYIDHGYVIKPHQLKETEHVATALEGYQVNQNNIGEIKEFAKRVTLFTDNIEKSTKTLNDQGVSWSAQEVATGVPDKKYAPIVRSEAAVRSDLMKVAESLSSGDKTTVDTAVAYGMAKLGEREAGFKMTDLIKESLTFSIGEVTNAEIEKHIETKKVSGELLIADSYVTTQHAYDLEKKILSNNQDGKNSIEAVFDKAPQLSSFLTQGQKDAVSLSLMTKDRFIAINGLAGTGKTTMMKELKDQAGTKGYSIVGIAPTHKAAQKLDESINEDVIQRFEKLGVPVMTAHKFIGEDMSQFNEKTIFITDESSMIGNRIFNDIQEKISSINARNIFSGDIGQQVSIENGKPMELSMANGIRYAAMNEIVRQKDSPILKQSAQLASSKNAGESLRNLEKVNPFDHIQRKELYSGHTQSFVEIGIDEDELGEPIYIDGKPSINKLYDAVAKDFLTRIPDQRDNTIVVASMHKFRQEIDTRIRDGLRGEGVIKNEVGTTRLMSKNLDQVDILHAKNFEKGDVLKFDKSFSIAKKGDHMIVSGLDVKNNKLNITAEDGNKYSINPAKIALKADMSVYEKLEVELGQGDRIRLRMSDKKRGWTGGSEYTVKELSDTKAIVENKQGMLTLDLKDRKDQHWDYAYTHTTYSVQGDTAKYDIGLEIYDNYRSNYIQITRPSKHAMIYTTNKSWLTARLDDAGNQQKADKISAYELVKNNQKEAVKISPAEEKQPNRPPQKQYIPREKVVLSKDLKPLLNSRSEELSLTLLGEPNKSISTKAQLRFGKNGSMTVNTKEGTWYSHEEGKGGNLFDLIARELSLNDFKDVMQYAKDFLNYTPDMQYSKQPKASQIKVDIEAEKDKAQKKAYAMSLYNKSEKLEGTVGEKYLSEHRGLTNYKGANIRFLGAISGYTKDNKRVYTPAILAYAKDERSEVNHIQIIRLNQDGSKNNDMKITKQTFGKMNGIAVDLSQKSTDNNNISYLSEGTETGLSILNIKKNAHVVASLSVSNFNNINPKQLNDKVIIALDNDFVKSPDEKKLKELKLREIKIKEAVERLEKNGKQVTLIIPNELKTDFNDTLNDKGFADLSKQINQFISTDDYKKMTETYIHNTHNNIHIDMKKEMELHKNSIKSIADIPNSSANNDRLSIPKAPNISVTSTHKNDEISHYKNDVKTQNKKMNTIKNNIDRNLKDQVKSDQIENISPPEPTKTHSKVKQMEL
ncbi:conjugative transfer relaxase/helicase TraI [Francisellaceae bacterium]|nr:conjugative transfer relaxase/helicase TraI [Francisellaceae bacterium]